MASVVDRNGYCAPAPGEIARCFYCSRIVELPAVGRLGHPDLIRLHPWCAEEWVIHLAKDAYHAAVATVQQQDCS